MRGWCPTAGTETRPAASAPPRPAPRRHSRPGPASAYGSPAPDRPVSPEYRTAAPRRETPPSSRRHIPGLPAEAAA